MIHGEVHRQKWGSKIVSEIMRNLKAQQYQKIGLGILDKNIEALSFWKSLGFQYQRTSVGKDETLYVYELYIYKYICL